MNFITFRVDYELITYRDSEMCKLFQDLYSIT